MAHYKRKHNGKKYGITRKECDWCGNKKLFEFRKEEKKHRLAFIV